MASQTVFRFTPGDGIDRLREFQEPIPTINDYEVLVKVRSVGLNYRDVAIVNNTYLLPSKTNVVPCSDMSGEVVQVGRLARGLAVGDAVVAPISPLLLYGGFSGSADTFGGTDDGMLREYVALPAHVLVKLPETTTHSFTQWAALPCTGLAVWNAFYGNMPLRPGDTVLLLGMTRLQSTPL
jgi:NADPH:quinone reductase-like Zn-dependent oxidoreductase